MHTTMSKSKRTKPVNLVTVQSAAGRALLLPDYVPGMLQLYAGSQWKAWADNHIEALVAGLPPAQLLHDVQEDCEEREALKIWALYVDACIAVAEQERGTARPPGQN